MFSSPTPYSLVAAKAQRYLDRLEEKIRTGQVSTRAGLLALVIEQLGQFFDTLSAPSFTVPRMGADELLIRQSITRPISQATEDLDLSNVQLDASRELSRQVFNVCQAERAGLSGRLAELTSLVDQFRLWVSDSDPSFQWSGDTFNSREGVDPGSTTFVDTLAGLVSLAPLAAVSLSDRVTAITIDQKLSQGGLSGNNLEIQTPGQEAFTSDQKEPRPVLFSETLPRKDHLPAVLDGNPDTWFEWERVYVEAPQPTILAGRAHVYDPSGKSFTGIPALANWNCFIRWPGSEGRLDTGVGRKGYRLAYFKPEDRTDLRLGLDISLDQPRVVSWLQLTPYIKNGTFPEVEQILVSADGEAWRKLLSQPTVLNPRINRGVDVTDVTGTSSNFEGVGVWALPRTSIRYVKIILRQSQRYETPLGIAHRFYNTIKAKKKKFLGITVGQESVLRRTEGPILQVGSFGSKLADEANTDFSISESDTQVTTLQAFDIFRAERQVIGIRDLLLEERAYAQSGQFIARPYTTPRPVRAVALLTTEQVPEEWGSKGPDGRPWIAYEVSEDGQSWQPIIPQATELEQSVVRFDQPTQTIHFRASFNRPEEDETRSPLLLAYALKLLT